MFWINKYSETKIEPLNKFKFLANFDTFIFSNSNPLNIIKEQPTNIQVLVKKITAPSINFEFERAFANEYVHYFQNGSIHWEPITISFIDVSQTPFGGSGFSELRGVLQNYLSNMTQETNRTNVIDLPVFCNQISIDNIGIFANSSYPQLGSNKGLNVRQIDTEVGNNAGSLETELNNGTYKINNSFIIKNPRITKIDFGNFDYSSDEINEINITIVPEWCSSESDFL